MRIGPLIVALALAPALSAVAQSAPAAPPAAPTASTAPSASPAAAATTAATPGAQTDDRILGVFPNSVTVAAGQHPPPLSVGGKFAIASGLTFDKFEFLFVGVLAGLGQVDHSDPSWGYGFGGYARRYGADFATQGTENFIVYGTLPSLLHLDPRYYQRGQGSVGARIVYAASRIVVTRTDSGAETFNTPEVAGSLATAGIANLYTPAGSRTVGETARTWASLVAIDAATNEAREFWPDVQRWLQHH